MSTVEDRLRSQIAKLIENRQDLLDGGFTDREINNVIDARRKELRSVEGNWKDDHTSFAIERATWRAFRGEDKFETYKDLLEEKRRLEERIQIQKGSLYYADLAIRILEDDARDNPGIPIHYRNSVSEVFEEQAKAAEEDR